MDYRRKTMKHNIPPPLSEDNVLTFTGEWNGNERHFGMTDAQTAQGLVVVGAAGSGKTEVILQAATQRKAAMTSKDAGVFFDPKGDYSRELAGEQDVILGEQKNTSASRVYWNVFQEALYDTHSREEVEENVREICTILFKDKAKHTTNVYFPNAARALMQGAMMTMILDAKESGDYSKLNNADFKRYISSFDSMEKWRRFADTLRRHRLSQAASHLETREAPSIVSELSSLLDEVFVSEFKKKGSFSIRRFIRERNGRSLFILYQMNKGATQIPVFSLLMNLAQAEAMSHSIRDGHVHLVLDEARMAKFSDRIEDTAAYGRGQGVRLVLGIQSITSFRGAFGAETADSIMSCLSNTVNLYTNDRASRQLVQDRCGTYLRILGWEMEDGEYREQIMECPVVQSEQLALLQTGEAVIQLAGKQPFLFKFRRYTKAN